MPAVCYLLVATRRADLSNHTIAIRSVEAEARLDAPRFAHALRADHVRVKVQAVELDAAGVDAIVEAWGREDARDGVKTPPVNNWPASHRDAYLRGRHDPTPPAP